MQQRGKGQDKRVSKGVILSLSIRSCSQSLHIWKCHGSDIPNVLSRKKGHLFFLTDCQVDLIDKEYWDEGSQENKTVQQVLPMQVHSCQLGIAFPVGRSHEGSEDK